MRLGLFDLLAPQFLADVQLLPAFHDIVSFLRVEELRSAWDETGVVHVGRALFVGEGGASPVPRHRAPSGAIFEWQDVNVGFRLTLPRAGAPGIKTVVDAAAAAAALDNPSSPVVNLRDTLNRLGDVPAAAGQASDYPGFAFRLELLITAVTLHLPTEHFHPAKRAADGWLERDFSLPDVKFVLPKVAVILTQDQVVFESLDADFAAWGVNSLDDPQDLLMGEMVQMIPSLCLHESGIVGFGLEKAVLDLSVDHTPPDILEQFGTGDDFRGLWLPLVRVFFAPKKTTGFAFDARAQDLLIDFNQGVSGEFAFEVINRVAKLNVVPRFFVGTSPTEVTRGLRVPGPPDNPDATVMVGSRATVPADAELQLSITGGQPPYSVSVTLEGSPIAPTPFNGDPNLPVYRLSGGARTAELQVVVQDSSQRGSPPHAATWDETIDLNLTQPGRVQRTETSTPDPEFSEGTGVEPFHLRMSLPQANEAYVLLQADPPNVASATAGGQPLEISAAGEIKVPIRPGEGPVTVQATWPTPSPSEEQEFRILFKMSVPSATQVESEVRRVKQELRSQLVAFLTRAGGLQVTIEGRASFIAGQSTANFNDPLSARRAQVAQQALQQLAAETTGLSANLAPLNATGFTDAEEVHEQPGYATAEFQVAILTSLVQPVTGTRAATVTRPPVKRTEIRVRNDPGPQPAAPESPPWFRKAGFRFRLERNQLVLAEVTGQFDLKTGAEKGATAIRNATGSTETPTVAVVSQPGATAEPSNPEDGLTDFRLTITYDTATGTLSEELAVGAAETDRNGLFSGSIGPAALNNILGALLAFAPILAGTIDTAVDAATAADGETPAVPITLAAGALVAAVTLGASGKFETHQFLLFGFELNAAQVLAAGPALDEFGILVDLGIDFFIDLDIGGIHVHSPPPPDTGGPRPPIRIRYRALGVRASFGNGTSVEPIFDTSRGYEFALADPGVITVDPPLGEILKILAARIARTNPTTLEVDLGTKVDLGVVTVDRIRINVPLDPAGPPTLLPTGIGIDIPGALSGSGFLDLKSGFRGSLDVTIIPTGLRVQAALGIEPITAGDRKVTGVIAALGVEFPSPIPIFNTGLGLYGVLGLFAMHFRRNENPAARVPALDWLSNPALANGDPTRITAWVPDIDRWAFGIGAVLGTLEGAFILNLKGMLALELPGPRILIFVKAQILSARPPTAGPVEELGILAVVDLNFATGSLTIGILFAYEVEKVISVKVPVEALFLFEDRSKWHLYAGTIDQPASAEVLGLVKARGYLMFDGHQIVGFPTPAGPITLPGLAVAAGVRAAVILGDEDSGLYLKVSANLDAGLTLSPFHLTGSLELRGTLRLFIVSVSAWASLTVEAPDPTLIDGEACGRVEFFFFDVEGCVEIHLGEGSHSLPPPPLVTGMSLQSRSPALVQGQGTDRPIDGSLGDAEATSVVSSTPDPDLLRVPIDAVPVLNLHAAPLQDAAFSTFTVPLPQAPRLFPEGWVDQGGGRQARYRLTHLEISPSIPAGPEGLPPAAWRAPTNETQGIDSAVDLALFSWEPDPAARAVERSTHLTDRVGGRWSGACDTVAPPAPVLWTFNPQPLGPRPGGWRMIGAALPDPPGVVRSVPPDTRLQVHEPFSAKAARLEPLLSVLQAEATGTLLEPAKVIGEDPRRDVEQLQGLFPDESKRLPGRVLQLPYQHLSDKSGLVLPDKYQELFDKEPQRVVVQSGAVEQVRLMLAVSGRLLALRQIRLRAFSQKGELLQDVAVRDLSPVTIAGPASLPGTWTDPAGPWAADIQHVLNYLLNRHLALNRILVEWKPPEKATRFEIVAQGAPPDNRPPSVLVGAIELLRLSEQVRFDHEQAAHESEIATIEGALAAGQPRPLLQPDTRYTVSLRYFAETRAELTPEDGSGFGDPEGTNVTQRFTFMTDAAPPARLEPWVLLTLPAPRAKGASEETAHFVNDPVRVVFNDRAAVQLFEAYGKSLKAVLRKANGAHPASQPPLNLGALVAVQAAILTPFEETLRDVIVVAELGCIEVPPSESHEVFTVNVPLERATAYTLDIETQDSPPDAPRTPLFRTAFGTSRFLSAAELAGVVRAGYVTQRLLRAPLPPLPDAPTDAELESALLAAGLEATPPATAPGGLLLWQPGGATEALAALLLDAPEPLWRERLEPELVVETGDGGEVRHWVQRPRRWLEVVEQVPAGETARVRQFVRSPGGTRTLVLLEPVPAGGTTLTLALRQSEPLLLNATPPALDQVLYAAPLPGVPPWRSDNG